MAFGNIRKYGMHNQLQGYKIKYRTDRAVLFGPSNAILYSTEGHDSYIENFFTVNFRHYIIKFQTLFVDIQQDEDDNKWAVE